MGIDLEAAKVAIRPLAPKDRTAVFKLGLAAFTWLSESTLWSDQVVRWYCENARMVSFVAECDHRIVGFALCYAVNATGCIEWIAVHERFRRQGIARRLMHRAMLAFTVSRVKTIVTMARADGLANELFQKFGFQDSGLRKAMLVFDPSSVSTTRSQTSFPPSIVQVKGGSDLECIIASEYDPLAEVYDVWAVADPAYTASHDFYVELCSTVNGIVVELGVGTGRIAVDVAKRGKPIIGIDVSSSMLSQCQNKAQNAGVEDKIELMQCDVRVFALRQKAELVIFPFRSIGHLLLPEDKKQALETVYDQLIPGGRLVFDHYVFNDQWARSHDGVPRLMHGHLSIESGGVFIWDTYRYDFAVQRMSCFITIEKSDNKGRVLEKVHCPLSFSWILPEQVRALAREVGFEVEALYGDFSYSDFNADSPNQLWFLRRPT